MAGGRTVTFAGGSPLLFNRRELNAYEQEILANPRATEREASKFFARFPKFLFLGSGEKLEREVELCRADGKVLGRVDFFRKNYGNASWDMIELKGPNAPLVVGHGGMHPDFSAPVWHAISQARDYLDVLGKYEDVRASLLKRGIDVYRPQTLVIVGREDKSVSDETMKVLCERAKHSQRSCSREFTLPRLPGRRWSQR